MQHSEFSAAVKLPSWIVKIGSLVIGLHVLSIGVLALDARSGPWSTAFGITTAEPPMFAGLISSFTTQYYLQPLGMSHNYHFNSNQTAGPDILFEVHLKDKKGKTIKKVKFPDKDANFWVHHRQELLAQSLGNDVMAPPRGPERVGAATTQTSNVTFWLQPEEVTKLAAENVLPPEAADDLPFDISTKIRRYVLISIPEVKEGAIPRNRPMFRPSGWAIVSARAYLRYLCRKYNAHSAELLRHHRDAVMPAWMLRSKPPEDGFIDYISHFGDLKTDLEEVQP